jgi:hypothetical protein
MEQINVPIVGIKQINDHLVLYLQETKLIPQDNKIEFQFSEKLEKLDELFYAYLLLFKRKFFDVEIKSSYARE